MKTTMVIEINSGNLPLGIAYRLVKLLHVMYGDKIMHKDCNPGIPAVSHSLIIHAQKFTAKNKQTIN